MGVAKTCLQTISRICITSISKISFKNALQRSIPKRTLKLMIQDISSDISGIRNEIDTLDTELHALLKRRTELVLKIADYKKSTGQKISVPAREAQLIRDILGRHDGAMPVSTLVQIWRELIGAFTFIQGESLGQSMKAAVSPCAQPGQDRHLLMENARDYFGISFPLLEVQNDNAAVNLVREGKADFAVVPVPADEHGRTDKAALWWHLLKDSHLNKKEDSLNILAKLPFLDSQDKEKNDFPALVIGRFTFGESGHDNSYLYVSAQAQTSRGRIIDLAKNHDINVLSMTSCKADRENEISSHLIEVEGYFSNESENIKNFAKSAGKGKMEVIGVGGYPVL